LKLANSFYHQFTEIYPTLGTESKLNIKQFNETPLGYYRDKINASEVGAIATEGEESECIGILITLRRRSQIL